MELLLGAIPFPGHCPSLPFEELGCLVRKGHRAANIITVRCGVCDDQCLCSIRKWEVTETREDVFTLSGVREGFPNEFSRRIRGEGHSQ